MYTCRRCLCKNCKCDGCNCNNKRTLIINRKILIFWVNGLKEEKISDKLCEKFKFELLSVDALVETEKKDPNSKFANEIKLSEKRGKSIDSNIIVELLKRNFTRKQENKAQSGYLIKSSPDINQINAFEKAVGSVNFIFNIVSSGKALKEELEQSIKTNSKNLKEENSDKIKEKKDKFCLRRKIPPQEILSRKFKHFNENAENIKKIYKKNFMDLKGNDLEVLIIKASKVIEKFVNSDPKAAS